MKKISFLSITALFCLLVLTACDRKQQALDNLSDFVEEVKNNASKYSDKDWEEADKEYDEIIAEIEKYDYSSKEAERIAKLKGKYAGIKTKEGVKGFFNKVGESIHEAASTIDGFKDGILGNEVRPQTNETDSSENNN